jgi:hypothetical protein
MCRLIHQETRSLPYSLNTFATATPSGGGFELWMSERAHHQLKAVTSIELRLWLWKSISLEELYP